MKRVRSGCWFTYTALFWGAERKGRLGDRWDQRMVFTGPKSFMDWTKNQDFFKKFKNIF